MNAESDEIAESINVICADEKYALMLIRSLLFKVQLNRALKGCLCAPLLVDLISADCFHDSVESVEKGKDA